MITIYVETNFILELAFAQEQTESCNSIIALCEEGKAQLVIPAFSIGECFETLVRRANARKKLANDIAGELKQISRSTTYREEAEASQGVTALLVRSSQDDESRLDATLRRILAIAEIIPLDASVILDAEATRKFHKIEGHQDSIVYASVMAHLRAKESQPNCFLNRNSKDFADPDIEQVLSVNNCKMLPSFNDGLGYINHIAG